jgi:DNA end-binding protein Ku
LNSDSPRSIWKGSISFGLVNIPIRLYSAADGKGFSFNQLCLNGHKIQYKKWCSVEEKEVPYHEIKKGYELSKDKYVIVEKEELQRIALKTTKTIDIKEFVDAAEFDPIFVEKSYYVAPEPKKGTNEQDKAYGLLVKVLKDSNKMAVGKVILRDNKEHLVALRAYQRGIVMHILYYMDEIKPVEQIKEISETSPSKIESKELELGQLLVENLTSEEFDISQYSDSYAKELEKLIDAKSKGKIFIEEKQPVAPTKDLVSALKASLEQKKSPKGRIK